jgi:hypothetical protein
MQIVHVRARSRLGRVALATWFGVMLALGAGLLAKHVVALPTPSHTTLEAALSGLRSDGEKDRWLAVHVLSSECRCSQRVAEHLASTVRPADYAEMVLWVGEGSVPQPLADRFDVRRIRNEDLARYGIEAAPLLISADPLGHVHYAGGYTSRKQGPEIGDRRLLREAQSSASVEALPLFGCATSDRLKRELSALPTP